MRQAAGQAGRHGAVTGAWVQSLTLGSLVRGSGGGRCWLQKQAGRLLRCLASLGGRLILWHHTRGVDGGAGNAEKQTQVLIRWRDGDRSASPSGPRRAGSAGVASRKRPARVVGAFRAAE